MIYRPSERAPGAQQVINYGTRQDYEEALTRTIEADGDNPLMVPWIRNGGWINVEGHYQRVWLKVKTEAAEEVVEAAQAAGALTRRR